ncbi:hypothetical protein, unlikely [Trypanosoma brucei gambiense DAL972]|uniref:Uncharacterized protein n=1 Tax=Trypanosoma brucei gambiense (strain MHOM/CI/86/DAL972) TaxID=679716 RepID=D0A454_TRYB9|nr:hypothetical protein, unlikely [Trypanosoma brucei gambiense DAL972]CBH16048.1 hypothetical protein, unlikely [Trypanosoma brucei gambiense DAL972]|eukprot:XP_011778312.1 hypothetical protein, unlikely [Trypanosoma brucei gambiense DAL972]
MVLWELCKPPFFSFFFVNTIEASSSFSPPHSTLSGSNTLHRHLPFSPSSPSCIFFSFKHSRYCYHNHQHHHGHYYIITITIFQPIFLFYSLLRILMTATAIPNCWLRLRLPAFSFDVSGFIRTKGRGKKKMRSFRL